MKQANDLFEEFQGEERGILRSLLEVLLDLTRAGDILWTSMAVESEVGKEESVRQFFYRARTGTVYWTLRSGDNGNPLLECFNVDNGKCGTRLLILDPDSEVASLGEGARTLMNVRALLEEVERQWQRVREKHEMHLARLKEILQELRDIAKQQQPDSAVPAESVESVEPVIEQPGDPMGTWLPGATFPAAEAEEESLPSVERAVETEEQCSERFAEAEAEAEAEFIEDCKTAEAEGAGDSAKPLDSLPGQGLPVLSLGRAPDPTESGFPVKPAARRRRRKKKTRVLDDNPKP